jgi:predicted flavoprotein YhiN
VTEKRVIVIGAGAGGLVAAGRAAECGAPVLLLEKMEQPGKKILISGKMRCNLTNTRDREEFIAMFGPNGRFLYSAFHRFFRDDLLALLTRYGVETKAERGGRIFPTSNDARDVVGALSKYINEFGVTLRSGVRVKNILTKAGRAIGVETSAGVFLSPAVILAAGGASYPATGSTGDGYSLARTVEHLVTPLYPALVPLAVVETDLAASMQGVSLRNARLTAWQCPTAEIDPLLTPTQDSGRGTMGKKPRLPVIESRQGELMFTHFGIGGPVTLLISLSVARALDRGPVSISVDLKPALSPEKLRARLQRDFNTYGKRSFRNIIGGLLPNKMATPFISLSGIPAEKTGHEISGEEKERLLWLLKALRFNVKSTLPMTVAMVTAGGVALDEIDPRTMESKIIEGLFFCGEVMDIDADTGGFNLQAAFSTGYVAGEAAARALG